MRKLIVLWSTLLLFGCNQQKMMDAFSTPADQAVAKGYIADLQSGRLDLVENDIDPSLKTPSLNATLARMAKLLPAGPPTSVKLVGANRLVTPGSTQINTTLEYQWGAQWVVCNVAIRDANAVRSIVGINVYPQKSSLEDQVRFTLLGKSPVQYLIFLGAVAAAALTLLALVFCILSKGLRRKWLWILFIIFGFGLISVNWTTGAVNFQLLYASLFSAGAFAPFYGPWTISMSLPVGAIIFIVRRLRRG